MCSPDLPPPHTSEQSRIQWASLSALSCGSGTRRSEPPQGMLLRHQHETTASVSIPTTGAQSPPTPRLTEGRNEFLEGEAVAFCAPLPLRPGSTLSKHQGSEAMICQDLV